jgi:hypothetical protein
MIAAESQPARHDRAVVFAADGAYARYALHAAAQIAALHPERDFDIVLCGLERAAIPDGLAHLGVRSVALDPGDRLEGLRLDEGRTVVVYLRLLLAEAFARDYARLLYLDADIFVERGDFSALLSAELGARALAAVRDNMQWRRPGRRPEQFRRLGLPAAPYFNAGVMLIDAAAWRGARITERAVELGRRERARMIRHDQNLLNAVLQGDWAEMHPAWNWQYTRASNLFAGMMDPCILHFIGPRKPWAADAAQFPPRLARSFAAFDAAQFGLALAGDPPPRPDRRWLRKSLWRHWTGLGPTCDLLDRFEDELTILS